MALAVPDLSGKWALAKQDNLDAFLVGMGFSWMARKAASVNVHSSFRGFIQVIFYFRKQPFISFCFSLLLHFALCRWSRPVRCKSQSLKTVSISQSPPIPCWVTKRTHTRPTAPNTVHLPWTAVPGVLKPSLAMVVCSIPFRQVTVFSRPSDIVTMGSIHTSKKPP